MVVASKSLFIKKSHHRNESASSEIFDTIPSCPVSVDHELENDSQKSSFKNQLLGIANCRSSVSSLSSDQSVSCVTNMSNSPTQEFHENALTTGTGSFKLHVLIFQGRNLPVRQKRIVIEVRVCDTRGETQVKVRTAANHVSEESRNIWNEGWIFTLTDQSQSIKVKGLSLFGGGESAIMESSIATTRLDIVDIAQASSENERPKKRWISLNDRGDMEKGCALQIGFLLVPMVDQPCLKKVEYVRESLENIEKASTSAESKSKGGTTAQDSRSSTPNEETPDGTYRLIINLMYMKKYVDEDDTRDDLSFPGAGDSVKTPASPFNYNILTLKGMRHRMTAVRSSHVRSYAEITVGRFKQRSRVSRGTYPNFTFGDIISFTGLREININRDKIDINVIAADVIGTSLGRLNVPLNTLPIVDSKTDVEKILPTAYRLHSNMDNTPHEMFARVVLVRSGDSLCFEAWEVRDVATGLSELELRLPIARATLTIHGVRGLRHLDGIPSPYVIVDYEHDLRRTKTVARTDVATWDSSMIFPVRDMATELYITVMNETYDALIGKLCISLSQLLLNHTYSQWCDIILPSGKSFTSFNGQLSLTFRVSTNSRLRLYKTYLRPIHRVPPPSTLEVKELLQKQMINEHAHRIALKDPYAKLSLKMVKAQVNRIRLIVRFLSTFLIRIRALMQWQSPWQSALLNVVWVFLCFNSHLVIPSILLCIAIRIFLNWRMRHNELKEISITNQLPHKLQVLADEGDDDYGDDNSDGSNNDEEESSFISIKRKRIGSPLPKNPLKHIQRKYKAIAKTSIKIQNVCGNVASELEGFTNVFYWNDPRVTGIVGATFMFAALFMIFVMPCRYVLAIAGVFMFRHPMFRNPNPSPIENLITRLPSHKNECRLLIK